MACLIVIGALLVFALAYGNRPGPLLSKEEQRAAQEKQEAFAAKQRAQAKWNWKTRSYDAEETEQEKRDRWDREGLHHARLEQSRRDGTPFYPDADEPDWY